MRNLATKAALKYSADDCRRACIVCAWSADHQGGGGDLVTQSGGGCY